MISLCKTSWSQLFCLLYYYYFFIFLFLILAPSTRKHATTVLLGLLYHAACYCGSLESQLGRSVGKIWVDLFHVKACMMPFGISKVTPQGEYIQVSSRPGLVEPCFWSTCMFSNRNLPLGKSISWGHPREIVIGCMFGSHMDNLKKSKEDISWLFLCFIRWCLACGGSIVSSGERSSLKLYLCT